MKKHIAFKIMLPLIVIFILTVTVNVSTTSQFQSFREVCEGMSNTTTEVPQEIRVRRAAWQKELRRDYQEMA